MWLLSIGLPSPPSGFSYHNPSFPFPSLPPNATSSSSSSSSSSSVLPCFRFQLMAPALTSNSFRLASSSLDHRPSSKNSAIVHARQQGSPFRFGRRSNQTSPDTSPDNDSGGKPNRFFFDLGKLSEPKSLVPVITAPSSSLFSNRRRKDPNTVYVAGATGQSGARIVLTLLHKGFAVRAGVPELSFAQELASLAAAYKLISPEESRRLNAVESTFADPESIAKAIGQAAKVVVTVGLGEDGPAGEVTANDALRVVRAAGLAGVGHVAVVYNLRAGGPRSAPSTYNVLDGLSSFFSNLFSWSPAPLTLSELLSKIIETDVAYTVVKASLTDDYADENSYTLVLDKESSAGGAVAFTAANSQSQVSKSQIAKLVADIFSHTSVAEDKVIEVSTSASATSKPVAELLSAIPKDGRRKAYAEAQAKAKAEEEQEAFIASEKAREAAEAAKRLEDEVKKLAKKEAQAKAEDAGFSLEGVLSRAGGLNWDLSWESLSLPISNAVSPKSTDEKKEAKLATVRGQAKARSLPPRMAIVKQPAAKPKSKLPKGEAREQKVEVRNVFGGLFKQETIYVDDD
ncbi:Protein TIC 62, chloroplastic [Apostasia shenzhenica]|uniref:Protein TIC 62, chloroplastic n=1 Tax=Apostasia shenzhenica TaxID=1088818 RepID=A0A2I0B2B4_9ASPA|nr:Protein TIC 62, chloroplastic [Apostasia shenzhenica]